MRIINLSNHASVRIVEPVYMQESQVTCVEVKNLLKNAYNQGVANTTQKLYDTLQNGGF